MTPLYCASPPVPSAKCIVLLPEVEPVAIVKPAFPESKIIKLSASALYVLVVPKRTLWSASTVKAVVPPVATVITSEPEKVIDVLVSPSPAILSS